MKFYRLLALGAVVAAAKNKKNKKNPGKNKKNKKNKGKVSKVTGGDGSCADFPESKTWVATTGNQVKCKSVKKALEDGYGDQKWRNWCEGTVDEEGVSAYEACAKTCQCRFPGPLAEAEFPVTAAPVPAPKPTPEATAGTPTPKPTQGESGTGEYAGLISDWQPMGASLAGGVSEMNMGQSVAISGNGVTLVAGGAGAGKGVARLYAWEGCCGEMAWTQTGPDIEAFYNFKGETVAFVDGDEFGYAVATNGDGSRVAISAPGYDVGKGIVLTYRKLNSGAWVQMGHPLTGFLQDYNDRFGTALAMSNDGNSVAVTAINEDGMTGAGVWTTDVGAAYVFQYAYGAWNRAGTPVYGQNHGEKFGFDVSLDNMGLVMAVSAPRAPVNGDPWVGEVRIFQLRRNGGWTPMGDPIFLIEGDQGKKTVAEYAEFGYSISLAGNGKRIAIGAPGQAKSRGRVHTYAWATAEAQQIDDGHWISYGKTVLIGDCGTRDAEGLCEFAGRMGSKVKMSASGYNLFVSTPNEGYKTDCGETNVYDTPECDPNHPDYKPGNWFPLEGVGSVKAYRYAAGRADWLGNGRKIWGKSQNEHFGLAMDFTDDANIVAIGAPTSSVGKFYGGEVQVWRDDWVCGPPGPLRCDLTCDPTCDFGVIEDTSP